MTSITVILCTRDPRLAVLRRVIAALAGQSLPPDRWRLLLVDNGSEPPVEAGLEAGSLPAGTEFLRESRPGLTAARIAGIRAATGDLLVFVDDDTILDPDYLERALALFESAPEIGVAGGRIAGEYERPPASWLGPHLGLLAVRDFGDRPIRALIYNECGPWEPCGAGMVVRREVAEAYAELASAGPRRRLDRTGSALSSCGDTDLARTAADRGLFMAYEPSLRLVHVIPRERLAVRYLARLGYSIQRDGWLLYRLRGRDCELPAWKSALLAALAPLRTVGYPPGRWLIRLAEDLGRLRGRTVRLEEDPRGR